MSDQDISKLENLQLKIAIAIDNLWLSIHKQVPTNADWKWNIFEKLQAGQKDLQEVIAKARP